MKIRKTLIKLIILCGTLLSSAVLVGCGRHNNLPRHFHQATQTQIKDTNLNYQLHQYSFYSPKLHALTVHKLLANDDDEKGMSDTSAYVLKGNYLACQSVALPFLQKHSAYGQPTHLKSYTTSLATATDVGVSMYHQIHMTANRHNVVMMSQDDTNNQPSVVSVKYQLSNVKINPNNKKKISLKPVVIRYNSGKEKLHKIPKDIQNDDKLVLTENSRMHYSDNLLPTQQDLKNNH